MARRALCPVLIGRDEPLSLLEDALLASSRGEGRVVAIGGEAGVGKTRVASELAARAGKLGYDVLWGGCTESELQLPYLPFVEAIGNWIAEQGAGRVAEQLGPSRRELAQIFPQLSEGDAPNAAGDPGQAKLRLLEAAVELLSIPAKERGLLLVVEDIHWADTSTRELLDHLARRTVGIRALIVATYRSDEMDRKHPLRPTLQSWRRSGTADIIALEPLAANGIASMIASILDTADVSDEFRDLLFERSDGNPFVVEELLKEAIDRADVFRTDAGWDRKPLDQIAIPETVRDTILLRLERLDAKQVAVLQAASVLGRSFDYDALTAVAQTGPETVQAALETAVSQQLIEEDRAIAGRYVWRHALTQEAIYEGALLPRRQQLHALAADYLASKPGSRSVEIAHHLLGAGRFADAIEPCLTAAEEAGRAFSFEDSIRILERTLPHVTDPATRGRVISRLGQTRLWSGESRTAHALLTEGIALLESAGLNREAAVFRLPLSRAAWESMDTDEAVHQLERARGVLEPMGPSADLALIHIRLAGIAIFRLDYEACIRESTQAIAIAEQSGAEFEALWAKGFLALGLVDAGDVDEGVALLRTTADDAQALGYPIVLQNTAWNEVWVRANLMVGDFQPALANLAELPRSVFARATFYSASGYAGVSHGDLPAALEDALVAMEAAEAGEMRKIQWRAHVALADIYTSMGRLDDAAAHVPPEGSSPDAQDFVYEAPGRIRFLLATGRTEEAVNYARSLMKHADLLAPYRIAPAAAAEAFVAAGLLDEARDALKDRGFRSDAGMAWMDHALGLVVEKEGDPAAAAEHFRRASAAAMRRGFRLVAARADVARARALHAAGDASSGALAAEAARLAADLGAAPLAAEAAAIASEHGIVVEEPEQLTPVETPAGPVEIGERMVSMLFADIRGYTSMTASTSPSTMTDRLTTLYRWAKAEVERHRGVVDKFAGDAIMATFNVAGNSVDHCLDAVKAALALRDKAALADAQVGIGIAVGPAVVSTTPAGGGNLMVMGNATNLAARLQAAAGESEILLSEEAFRRSSEWLAARGLDATTDTLTLKGFDDPVRVYRIRAAVQADK